MGITELLVLIIFLLTAASVFFELNCLSIRSFSRIKLQDALKSSDADSLVDDFAENAENFLLSCSILRLIANLGILAVLATLFLMKQ